jgi:AcrR family transcriptional regulator
VTKPAEQTRDRIIESGYELFYRNGFNRVGVDEIAAAAGVTKRTLYYHFRSKDDLLASVLEFHHALALARIRKWGDGLAGDADAVLDGLFEEIAKWATRPRYAGAGFTRIVMELADLPGHPARAVARRHKSEVETWLTALLEKANVAAPSERAREVVLLMEGAMALMLTHGDCVYVDAAARAAKQLVRSRADNFLATRETAPDGVRSSRHRPG